jgi:hypothetical protein
MSHVREKVRELYEQEMLPEEIVRQFVGRERFYAELEMKTLLRNEKPPESPWKDFKPTTSS